MATRSDYAYYPKLWQKSYLIEIVQKDSGALHRSYALSLPPESSSISVPQRVNVKKTFGGAFVDDYGVDLMPISIKGTTGNSQLKEIYRDGTTEYINGKNEAYLIMQDILQYKHHLVGYENYEMRLFDLSSVAEAITGTMLSETQSLDANGWRVVLKDGKIDRSKDKPFFYNYELEFVALEPIGIKSPKKSTAYKLSAVERILSALDKIKELSAEFKKVLAAYQSVVDKIKILQEVADTLLYQARVFYQTAQGFVDTTASGVSSVFEVISFPAELTIDLQNAVLDMRDSFEGVFQSYYNGVTDLEARSEKIAELNRQIFDIETWASVVRKESKGAGAMPDVHIVPLSFPGATVARSASDSTVELGIGYMLTYGYRTITATSESRLDVIAKNEYGNADYADIIAKYNGINGDTDLYPGLSIKLPYLKYTAILRDSEIYSSGQEVYGTDISLSSNGDLTLAEYNDFATISGIDNMVQAIDMRISEDDGSRIRIDAYGIKQSQGSFDPFAFTVLLVSIRDTLIQDPRIQTARNFKLVQDGDVVKLAYDVVLEAGSTLTRSISI